LNQQQFGFHLEHVDKVISAVEVTPFPHMPQHAMGMIDINGDIIPVISLRAIFGLQEKEIELSDKFLICHLQDKKLALCIDAVLGIVIYPKETMIAAKDLFFNLKEVD